MTWPAPRSHVALDHDLSTPDRHARNGAGVSANHHGSPVHVVGKPPPGISLHVEPRRVGQSGTEVPGRAADMDIHRMNDADADVMARVGVQGLDGLALGGRLANPFIGFAGREITQIDRDHVS